MAHAYQQHHAGRPLSSNATTAGDAVQEVNNMLDKVTITVDIGIKMTTVMDIPKKMLNGKDSMIHKNYILHTVQ